MFRIIRTRDLDALHADLAHAQKHLASTQKHLTQQRAANHSLTGELRTAVSYMSHQFGEDHKRGAHILAATVDLLTGEHSLDDARLQLAHALLAYDSTGRLLRVLRRCPDCGTRGHTQDVPVPIPGTDDFADTVLCDACGATWGIDPGADGICDDCGGSSTQGTSPNAAPCPCPHGSIAAS